MTATTMLDLKMQPVWQPAGTDTIHCITQDAEEPAGPEFRAVCDDNPVDVMTSRFCPPLCGGHPICAPCLEMSRERGLVA